MKARIPALALCLAALPWHVAALAHGGADGSPHDTLDLLAQVRAATLPYRDVGAATAAGYGEFRDAQGNACITQPGQGSMGIHYLNGALVGDAVVDPLQPEALTYEQRPDGSLELLGAEYIVFQSAWDALHPQPPVLFGHPFHLVREPNRYGVPAFYELHLWLWRHNTGTMFDDWNPRVSCP